MKDKEKLTQKELNRILGGTKPSGVLTQVASSNVEQPVCTYACALGCMRGCYQGCATTNRAFGTVDK